MMLSRRTVPFALVLMLGCLVFHDVAQGRSAADDRGRKGGRRSATWDANASVPNEQILFCHNKSPTRVVKDFTSRLTNTSHPVLVGTKATRAQYDALVEAVTRMGLRPRFDEEAGVITVQRARVKKVGKVVVATAGTADIPVAEEAALVAEALGNRVVRIYNCGVNKLERVASYKRAFEACNVVIAVAGMEGGLPNAVAALAHRPVIGVPTSVGYGTGAGGLITMGSMMNACSPGITVVNIDNGFGAAYFADMVNKQSVAAASASR